MIADRKIYKNEISIGKNKTNKIFMYIIVVLNQTVSNSSLKLLT